MTTSQAEPGDQSPLSGLRALQTEQADPDQAAAALLALGQDCAARLADPWRTADHGAFLYDDKGLPR
jgi:hypothetical protein